MRYFSYDITLTDVPGEISLAFAISGCNLKCRGCFLEEIKKMPTNELSDKTFTNVLKMYINYISCVLFYGGEWHENDLISKLIITKQFRLNSCLYTGLKRVSTKISRHLTYLKTGSYNERFGPLTSPTTNQKLINLLTNENLTSKFWYLLPKKY